MIKKFSPLLFSLIANLFIFSGNSLADSEVTYPSNWKSWTSVSSPLAGLGALPGCDADVSNLPPIYQETVEIYCGVRPQGPGAVEILVNPSEIDSYKVKGGIIKDGPAMILHLKDMKILFITGYKDSKATYGVFKEDGTDITVADPASLLSVNTCRTCHTGYEAFCTNGQCATAK